MQRFILRQILIFRSSAVSQCGLSHAFSEELNNKKSAELPKMRHLCLMGGAGLMKALIFVMLSVNENE